MKSKAMLHRRDRRDRRENFCLSCFFNVKRAGFESFPWLICMGLDLAPLTDLVSFKSFFLYVLGGLGGKSFFPAERLPRQKE